MNEPSPQPTPQQVRAVANTRNPLFQPPAPKKLGRSSALIGGNIRPGMVPGGFSQELARTSNAASDRRLASRNRKTPQPTPEQIREVADQFLARPRPTADVPKLPVLPPPPPPPPPHAGDL